MSTYEQPSKQTTPTPTPTSWVHIKLREEPGPNCARPNLRPNKPSYTPHVSKCLHTNSPHRIARSLWSTAMK